MNSEIPIFTFHAMDETNSVIAFTPQAFASGLKTLTDNGFRTISLLDAANCLAHHLPFPNRSVVITFDDGYQSVYETAFPLLQEYKLTATVFLTLGSDMRNSPHAPFALDAPFASMNGRTMLTWRQVGELSRYGIEIGAHTVSHPDLTRISRMQAKIEILRSQTILQDALGVAVTSFAYPFGRYDDHAYEIVRENFVCACTDRLQLVNPHSDLHLLSRVDAYYLRNSAWLKLLPTGFFSWYIQARAVPRNLRRSVQQFAVS